MIVKSLAVIVVIVVCGFILLCVIGLFVDEDKKRRKDSSLDPKTTKAKEVKKGTIKVKGIKGKFKELTDMLDDFEFWFNIVTP